MKCCCSGSKALIQNNVVKCNLSEVKRETMLVWSFPCLGHAQWWGICRRSRGLTARVLWSTHLHVHFCLATLLPALPSPFSGKYVVSIMVPLSFVSVTVPGGCRSQGCHGYPTRSAPVLEAPPSFQAPSSSSSIVDEFNYYYLC